MAKTKSNRILTISVLIIVGLCLFIGGYFIGHATGSSTSNNDITREDNETKAEPDYSPEYSLAGTYSRSFYNNYNKSVESYVVLKDDGSCKYVSAIASEYATEVDLTTMQKGCSYEFDKDKKTGKITVYYYYKEDGVEKAGEPTIMTFTYDSGAFLLGGASYYRVQ